MNKIKSLLMIGVAVMLLPSCGGSNGDGSGMYGKLTSCRISGS